MKKIYLKPGKEIPVKNKHHWIFSGGVQKAEKFNDGDIAQVYSSRNELLGHAYLNNKTVIAARMINFSKEDPLTSISKNIEKALKLRIQMFDSNTNCYRVINSEADLIPGLTVDRYNEILVIQISTIGIDRLKNYIVDSLLKTFRDNNIEVKTIYEKSLMSSRKVDGLSDFEGILYGKEQYQIEVLENGIKFLVDVKNSQKTGLFLDMREMRKNVGEIAKNKKVLNCFSYTGGFSLYAFKNGAIKVDSVDIAKDAIESARKNFEINNLDVNKNGFFAEDVFIFLERNKLDYDLVILDPPAFAKKRKDIENAKRGYYKLNKLALSKMPSDTMLLTCSCSYHVNHEMFEEIVKKASRDANREVKILSKHRLAPDHPINIFHSEIDYLKSLLLYVN